MSKLIFWLCLDMPTLMSDDNTSDSEPEDPLSSIYEQTPCSDPHIQQTEWCQQFLEATGDISDRALILKLMDKLHLNLPVFLWAISWNVPELTSNPVVHFSRTVLMVSNKLPGILTHWHGPTRFHSQGIRTQAARKALNGWALDAIYRTLDNELACFTVFFRCIKVSWSVTHTQPYQSHQTSYHEQPSLFFALRFGPFHKW